MPLFFCDARVEYYMEEYVAELLAKVLVVASQHSIAQLINLFHGHRPQAFSSLRRIPRALRPQRLHYLQRLCERRQFFFFCMHGCYFVKNEKCTRP